MDHAKSLIYTFVPILIYDVKNNWSWIWDVLILVFLLKQTMGVYPVHVQYPNKTTIYSWIYTNKQKSFIAKRKLFHILCFTIILK